MKPAEKIMRTAPKIPALFEIETRAKAAASQG